MLRRVTWSAGIVALFAVLIPGPSRSAEAVESPHAYFDQLVNRPEHWKSYSLRDRRQLQAPKDGGYAHCNSCPLWVTYDPENDPDPRRQDAAKVLIPENKVALQNQVRVPMGTSDGNSYFITWDAWFGAEYEPQNTRMTNQKTFQFASDENIWFEMQTRWNQGGRDGLALATARGYVRGNQSREQAFGPNVQGIDPLMPMVGSFIVRAQTWTRYFVVIDQRASDYDLSSLWIADENTNPVQILDKLQLNAANGKIDSFWLEFATSSEEIPPGRGPLVAYVRNIAMLRNVVDPRSLMQRPNAGTPLPPPPPPPLRPAAPKNLRIVPPPQ